MQSILFFAERLLPSISRYAVTFYCLDNFNERDSNIFFHQNAIITLLFVFCHFGLDVHIIGRVKNRLEVNGLYTLRLIGAIIMIMLYFFLFYTSTQWIASILVLALIGVAVPAVQINALVDGNILKIARFRLLPELFSALVRVFAIVGEIKDPLLMMVAFFFSEITFGIIAIITLISKNFHVESGKLLRENLKFKINELRPILFGVIVIILLFCFQRGDILLWTTINPGQMNESLKIVIKSQQFFDMAGVLSAAALSLIIRFNKSYHQGMLIVSTITVYMFGLAFVLLALNLEVVKVEIDKLIGSYDPMMIPVFLSLGLGTYLAMMKLDLSFQQVAIMRCLVITIIVKLALFIVMLESRPLEYSSASAAVAFFIFTFAAGNVNESKCRK